MLVYHSLLLCCSYCSELASYDECVCMQQVDPSNSPLTELHCSWATGGNPQSTPSSQSVRTWNSHTHYTPNAPFRHYILMIRKCLRSMAMHGSSGATYTYACSTRLQRSHLWWVFGYISMIRNIGSALSLKDNALSMKKHPFIQSTAYSTKTYCRQSTVIPNIHSIIPYVVLKRITDNHS